MPAATSSRLSSCLRPGKHPAIGSKVRGHPIDAMHHFDDIIDLPKALIREPSVVGAGHAFCRVLQRELEERGPQVTWYEGLLVAPDSPAVPVEVLISTP